MEINIGNIISEGIQLGIRNLLPLMVNLVLYILTIWIPYLNVGTTIGIIGLIAKMGRDGGISHTEIFSKDYRKYMGEFILVMAFMGIGVMFGIYFLLIPGIVIAIAWGQASLLVIDKGFDPIAAIKKSNDLTYGKKWDIFLGLFIMQMIIFSAIGIISFIGMKIHPTIGMVLSLAALVVAGPIFMGAQAFIYRELSKSL